MAQHRPFHSVYARIKNWLACWLSCDIGCPPSSITPFDFQRILQTALPCDIWLIEGRSRVSRVINIITRSTWSHAALYIGYIHDIADTSVREHLMLHCKGYHNEPLLIESLLDEGVILKPANTYQSFQIRVCRPQGLLQKDARQVIAYAAQYLGYGYDVQQLFDLARFLLPWGILPRRWRSSLFCCRPGTATKFSCSFLLAEAFSSVRFPILPLIKKHKTKGYEFVKRNPKLFTPRDFDISPFFTIIKHPVTLFSEKNLYQHIYWSEHNEINDDSLDLIQYTKPAMPTDKIKNDKQA